MHLSKAKYDAIVAAAQFDRPAKELLHALVDVFLDTPIPLRHVTYFEASALDQRPERVWDPDTFVRAEIDPLYDYHFPGKDGFQYRRLSLKVLPFDPVLPLYAPEFPFHTHDMLEQLNRSLGVQFTEDDIENDLYEFGAFYFKLRAKPGSWCWFGDQLLAVNFTTTIPDNVRVTHDGSFRVTVESAFRIAVKE